MSNYISYWDLLNSREEFKKSSGTKSSDFNKYDTPGHKYFKLFFYFYNGDVTGDPTFNLCNGLLAPTWLTPHADENSLYMYNSAWSYLQLNDEEDRAGYLEDFVNLLSNISSESPWYFSEISGLDAAMERKQTMADDFVIDASRQKISIKCLPDSFDDRIGTLLDLYRSIVWDWTTKREILPANLRKFDMGILLFETPNAPFHIRKQPREKNKHIYNNPLDESNKNDYAYAYSDSEKARTSYKFIEFHNCEIDYGSSKNFYSSLNNKDGISPEYTIDIHFDDCYESRYNEFSVEEFGDYIISSSNKNKGAGDGQQPGVSNNMEKIIKYGNDIAAIGEKDRDHGFINSWTAVNNNPDSDFNENKYNPDSSIFPNITEKNIDESRLHKTKDVYNSGNIAITYGDVTTKIINGSTDGKSWKGSWYTDPNWSQVQQESLNTTSRLNGYPPTRLVKNGFLMKAVDQLVSTGMSKVDSFFKKAVLGNLYTFSLTRLGSQLKSLASGDVITAARNVQEYVRDHKQRNSGSQSIGGDLFPETGYEMGKPKGSLHETPNVQPGTLSPSFIEPTGYEMGKPSGTLPGEVKPKEQHKQSDMFPIGTQAWTKSNGGAMFAKKKIKPSVKYIGKMFEGGSIANNL